MAGKERGKNVLVKLEGLGSPSVFTALAGQRGATLQINGNTIDTSDKTSEGWGTALAGLKTMTIPCNGIAEWPDTDGLDVLRQAATSNTDDGSIIRARIVLNSAGAYYEALFAITNLEIDGPHDDATSYSFTLVNTNVPTYSASGG
jgi:TP901-1 family phage major tail protein